MGSLSPVRLEIRLYQETPAFETYIKRENLLFQELFVPAVGQSLVLVGYSAEKYDSLRDSSTLGTRRQLNHTLIFQVDEYWALDRGALRQQNSYLDAVTIDFKSSWDKAVDPLCLFQPSRISPIERHSRRDFFRLSDHGMPQHGAPFNKIDRLPFAWDFGFLLCRERCWVEAADQRLKHRQTVGQIWELLKGASLPQPPEDNHKRQVKQDSKEMFRKGVAA